MGRPKLLLPWRGRAIISDVVERACVAATHVVIVTGHDATATGDTLAGQAVQIVHNADYADGEMISSVKTGIATLPPMCEAFYLVLGDQPGIAANTFALLSFRPGPVRSVEVDVAFIDISTGGGLARRVAPKVGFAGRERGRNDSGEPCMARPAFVLRRRL